MEKIKLKKNEERRIKKGHLWIFSNEIESHLSEDKTGTVVEVANSNNEFLAYGFYNRNSLITVRIFSFEKSKSDPISQFKDKFNSALQLRKSVYPTRNSYRLFFSEGDLFPGIIIDKYNDTLVLQINSVGIEKIKSELIPILIEQTKAKNILTKNDFHFRKMEGLSESDEILFGNSETEIIDDGAIKYEIDFSNSQKTGFFFDQSDNRHFIERFSNGKKVFDGFCNSGGFGLHAAYANAEQVTFVDSSEIAIGQTKNNFALNNFNSNAEFIVDDVFDCLKNYQNENKKFEVMIIDPPAFIKTKKNFEQGKKGYEKLNSIAINCIYEGGFLVTSSCSSHLEEKEFQQIINAAAMKSKRRIKLIYKGRASLDHPINPIMPETNYLKFFVFQVL